MKAVIGISAAVLLMAACTRVEAPYIAHGEEGREPEGSYMCEEVAGNLQNIVSTAYDYISPRGFWQSGTNTSCRLWFNTNDGGLPCSVMEDLFNAALGQQLGGDTARVEATPDGCRWLIWVDATRVERSLR